VVTVKSLKNQQLIADKCHVAESFSERLTGLIGKTRLEAGFGMLFPRCNDIHMWFMRIPIDVVFARADLSADGKSVLRVTRVVESVKPWRLLPLRDGSASETLELPVGTIRRCDIREGDELCLS
jgi:uncharacterized membrane protein (UPF0127 family)